MNNDVPWVVRPRLQQLLEWASSETLCDRDLAKLTHLSQDGLDELRYFGMITPAGGGAFVREQVRKLPPMIAAVERTLDNLALKHPVAKPLAVDIWPMDPDDEFGIEKLRGVSGYTSYEHLMTLVVHSGARAQALEETVVHEYHHHWRIAEAQLLESQETLLSRLVLEGLAEHFVEEILGMSTAPWATQWTDQESQYWWPVYAAHLNLVGSDTSPYMFGSTDMGVPLWAGYAMGYHLIRWFRRQHPALSWTTLTQLADVEFVPRV